jgi:hypothetical protein
MEEGMTKMIVTVLQVSVLFLKLKLIKLYEMIIQNKTQYYKNLPKSRKNSFEVTYQYWNLDNEQAILYLLVNE